MEVEFEHKNEQHINYGLIGEEEEPMALSPPKV